jgi:hypothetical protein
MITTGSRIIYRPGEPAAALPSPPPVAYRSGIDSGLCDTSFESTPAPVLVGPGDGRLRWEAMSALAGEETPWTITP